MLMWTGLLALVNDVGSRRAICVAACLFGVPAIPKGLLEGLTNRGGVNDGCMVWVNLANGAWFEFRWLSFDCSPFTREKASMKMEERARTQCAYRMRYLKVARSKPCTPAV